MLCRGETLRGARCPLNIMQFADGRLTVSSIYKWFADDFGGAESAVLAHLARFAEPELAARLAGYDGRIRYDYDWSLNEP